MNIKEEKWTLNVLPTYHHINISPLIYTINIPSTMDYTPSLGISPHISITNFIINFAEHIRPPEWQLDMRQPDVPGTHHFMITNCNSFIWTGLSEMTGNRTRNTQTSPSGRPSPAAPHPTRQSPHFNPPHANTVLSLLYHYCRPTSGLLRLLSYYFYTTTIMIES